MNTFQDLEEIYRLEFNETTQKFQLVDRELTAYNSKGWSTIGEYCTEWELKMFQAYLDSLGRAYFSVEDVLTFSNIHTRYLQKLIDSRLIDPNPRHTEFAN